MLDRVQENKILQELNKAILEKNSRLINKILLNYSDKINNKEIFYHAIKTRDIFVVSAVGKNLNPDIIDNEMIRYAINSNIDSIVKYFCDRTNIQFDKSILNLAIEKRNVKLLKSVLTKISNNLFDKEIFQNAVQSKNREIVRLVINKIEDRSFLEENEQEIRNSIFNEDDVKAYVGQILSIANNKNKDYEYQGLTFDIYCDVVINNYNKGKIPENFPLKDFIESMKESKIFHSNYKCEDFKFLNKTDKFLIVPIYSSGHGFSGIVRKLENSDRFGVTLVNLGSMPNEKLEGSDFTYVEYEIEKNKLVKLLGKYSKNPRTNTPLVPVKDTYNDFKRFSIGGFNLKLTSRSQKLGNCFIKNTEKAIRLALSLGITKSLDQRFKQESLRKTYLTSEKSKIKFMKSVRNDGFELKDLDTLSLKTQLVNALIKRLPKYKIEINEVLSQYKESKMKINSKSNKVSEG